MSAPPRAELLEVLHHLVAGATAREVVTALHLSPRTLDRRLAELKRLLRARRPFCLGCGAMRAGWVADTHPISTAFPRRTGDEWTPPTSRQRHAISLLAAGIGLAVVAAEVGRSARTVRLDLSRLGTVNGARGPAHAGALFEALGWTRPE